MSVLTIFSAFLQHRGLVLCILFGLLCCLQSAHAQGSVSTRLSVGLWDVDGRIASQLEAAADRAAASDEDFDGYQTPRLYALTAGEAPGTWESQEFHLSLNSISRSFHYSGPQEVRFYLQPPATEKGALKPDVEPVGTVQLPEDSNNSILLFHPREDPEAGYRIFTIDADGSNFPAGNLQVLNLSERELQFAIGGERLRIPSRQMSAVKPGARDDSFRVRIASWNDNTDNWEICFSRFQPPIRDQRRLCLIVDAPRQRGGIDVRFFGIPD